MIYYKYKKISQQIGFSNIGAGKSSIDGFEEYDIELLFDSIPSAKEVTMKWNKIIENSGLEGDKNKVLSSMLFKAPDIQRQKKTKIPVGAIVGAGVILVAAIIGIILLVSKIFDGVKN